ncbi:cation transport ATPase component [Microbacterium sp. TS-1]|jgi:potassium-transporting ATPase KdpC subunit|uniref:potassium-transporting ATPase subunit KdpC n=1 Tax=unclassified Microbacterium TaxID=2609290 RepID=UPI00038F75E0|nr:MULTISPECIES: potassium-transporting ATPase subunit KdpC [unclassified Microbacterium]POX68244.1 potassium-transporting ATPase subunit KdpC [Microbacterium sp. Ru50]QCR39093.1 potassium-transporting ATPase subunit KdpC [Microbacterium sp. SGAir0570]GAD34420.1 cation transport ATPase component [Microbacterium sp. TS-1]
MSTARASLRTSAVAVRAMVVLTLVLGVGYTLLISLIGLALPAQANGSLLRDAEGQVVGSSLIGQSFTDADGEALPQYFQSRPSAAGDGYDAAASSGSNLGPNNADLVAAIEERRTAIADREGVAVSDVPPDAVTASASGLDPHISPAYAELQVARVAAERGLSDAEVRDLVAEHTAGRDLGFLGEPRVNVVELNAALDGLAR